jgi:hypothetical protein
MHGGYDIIGMDLLGDEGIFGGGFLRPFPPSFRRGNGDDKEDFGGEGDK